MHIPQGDTDTLNLLPFAEALAAAEAPQEDYDSGKWWYIPPFYGEYRYLLGTKGTHPLICVGINPSTAAPGALDNTLKSVERIARFNGYDSFLMFNVYAQRATNPNDMEKACNPLLHQENMAAFAYALAQSQRPAVWAAWGAIVEKRGYLTDCLRAMVALGQDCGAQWFSAGAPLKNGHPHHPLYLRKDSLLTPFDMGAYLG
ncbi:MAG: DUF1643 domain-containing protein [Oscillospiraceae bacterium]